MSAIPSFIASPAFSTSRHRRAKRHNLVARANRATQPDVAVEQPTKVRDNAFAQFCISMFRSIMQPQIGWKSRRSGYDGLIEECRMLLARKGPQEQQRVVRHTLDTLFQAPRGPAAFRKHFSDKPGFNAAVTPMFFQWLVGDCYTNRPEEGGYGVYIEKCRFLEESGCKGLCVNMCQQPTQRYFKDVLGLPVRMTPNYEDMSCQMTYGVQPLPISEDPAVTGDCLQNCKMSSSVRLRGDPTCYVSKEP